MSTHTSASNLFSMFALRSVAQIRNLDQTKIPYDKGSMQFSFNLTLCIAVKFFSCFKQNLKFFPQMYLKTPYAMYLDQKFGKET